MRRLHGPLICWNCQQEGHIATYCPNARAHQDYIPLCRICSEEGHEDKDCPKNSVNLAKMKGKQKMDDGASTLANLVEVVMPLVQNVSTLSNPRKRVSFSELDS